MNILKGKLLVSVIDNYKKTEGGIFLPDTIESKTSLGKVVVSRGDEVKEGDTVIYMKGHGVDVKVDGVEYFLMDEKHVLYFY